ncbi:ABC transporter substrate-binding protein [Facklamia miroungae]|uniref:Raffinose/stachyose/melibiose transport system substrate-binding protein n=1 Tax=Facklamia miroungae TaxID=120956 RepID=A0A1G7T9Y3_9LACT|nr:ABC transporter substrate-binding protein [Facklamia miroungae]NKZ29721.1 carbohydrate ABC transporter substrate-binding protein [Facklamia miroungae]SDG31824.1 raffinose/stachyose/melibiose transport system substrate-binding protein [Facklamia miroungae]
MSILSKISKASLVLAASSLISLPSASAASDSPEAFTLYSNKSETQEALTNYAKAWGEANGVNVTVKVCSGSCTLGDQLKSDFTAGDGPDVFVIEGQGGYDIWADFLTPLEGNWIDQTEFEFKQGDDVYGFPVSVEGYGLAYNADLLEKAGIDPASLDSFEAVKAAFEDLENRKEELGLTSVVANATKEGETWIMGNHDFNAYLGTGLENGDRTITEMTLAGEVDQDRMANYADWVELLFQHTDKQMLTVGTQEDMDIAFATGQAAFLHQGNWKDPNLSELEADFEMGFIPYQTLGTEENADGLFIGAPSYYVVNKESGAMESINKFFQDMVDTPEGQDFIVNQANMISPFSTTKETPKAPMSAFLAQWIVDEKPVYSFDSTYFMPDGFGMNNLGPIYGQFAQGNIDKDEFIQLMSDEISQLSE